MKKLRWSLQGFRFKMGENESEGCVMALLFCLFTLFLRAFRVGISADHLPSELYLWLMGNPENLVFIQGIFVLAFVPKVILSDSEDVYFFMHKGTKMDIWKTNMASILLITLIYCAAYTVMAGSFSLFSESGGVAAGGPPFAGESFDGLFSSPGVSLPLICLGLFGNTAGYILCTGFLYYLFLLLARRRWQATGAVIGLTALDFIIYHCGPDWIGRLTFLGNILPVYRADVPYMNFHVLYWGCAVGLLCFFTRRTAERTRLLWKDGTRGMGCGRQPQI